MSEHDRPLIIETTSAFIVRSPAEKHVVRVDASVLYAALNQARNDPMPGSLRLNLAPDFTVTLETQHIEQASSGCILWRGGMTSVPGIHGSFAVSGLDSPTAKNIQLAGSVTAKGVSYRILPTGQNLVCITKCHPVVKAPADVPIKDNSALMVAANLLSPASAETEASPLAVIHIKALYPETVLHRHPLLLEASFLPLIMYSMEVETNRVFANSKIPARVSIETLPLRTPTTHTALNELYADALENPPGSPDLRREIASVLADGATDIVVLLATYASHGSTETSYVQGRAGSIPRPPVAVHATMADRVLVMALSIPDDDGYGDYFGYDPVGELVLAHELGHLLGASHDRITEHIKPSSYDYVCGYVPKDKSFFTVMGYHSAAPHGVRAPLYSDHTLTWNRQPAGIAPGQPGAASAAMFLRWSAQEVSRYKSKGKWPGQQHDWVALDLQVGDTAELTDQVILSMPGPYPKNTVVTVSALREREIGDDLLHFQYWELDGKHYSDALTIQVTMDQPHKLKAHIGKKERLSFDDIRNTLTPQAGELVFLPPMPKEGYQHGADVTVFYRNPPEGKSYVPVAWALDGTNTERYSMWTNIRIGSKPIHLAVNLGVRKHRVSAHCVPADIGFLMNFGDEEVWREGAADNQKLRLNPVDALSLEFNSTFNSLAIDGAKMSWTKSEEYSHIVKHDTQIIASFQGHESVLPLGVNFDPPEAEIEGRCGRVALRTKLGNKEGKVRALKRETLLIRRDAWVAISPRTHGELSYYDHLLDPPQAWELVAWSLGDGVRQTLGASDSYQFQLTQEDAPTLTLHFKKIIG